MNRLSSPHYVTMLLDKILVALCVLQAAHAGAPNAVPSYYSGQQEENAQTVQPPLETIANEDANNSAVDIGDGDLDDDMGIELQANSIAEEDNADPEEFTSNFLTSGVTVPGRGWDTVLLPHVPDRTGLVWNREPFTSDEFSVNVTFTMSSESNQLADGQGWGFFLTTEDFAANYHLEDFAKGNSAEEWHSEMEKAGLNLYGWRNKYNGVGVIFDRTTYNMPRVFCLENDGTKEFDIKDMQKRTNKIPSHPYVFLKPADVTEVRVAVRHSRVKVSVMDQGTERSVCILSGIEKELQGKLYAGFSGYTGPTPQVGADGKTASKPAKVSIHSMHISSFDTHHVAQSRKEYNTDSNQKEGNQALDRLNNLIGMEEEDMVTQQDQTAQINRLAKGIESLIQERRRFPLKNLQTVAARIQNLEQFAQTLNLEVRTVLSGTRTGAMKAMKTQMDNFRSVMHLNKSQQEAEVLTFKESEMMDKAQNDLFRSKIDLGSKEEEIKEKVENAVQASNRTFYAIGFFGFLVVFWTVVFNVRMNAIEKKKHLV